MLTVVLDTCVLWPGLRRDFLLALAAEELYRPRWSDVSLEELEFCEQSKLTRRGVATPVAADRARELTAHMRSGFPDAEVTEHRRLRPLGLPDPADDHVVGSALVSGADLVVSDMTDHFPSDRLPGGLASASPAAFALEVVASDPRTAARALDQVTRGRAFPDERTDAATLLALRYGMGKVAELLRPWTPARN